MIPNANIFLTIYFGLFCISVINAGVVPFNFKINRESNRIDHVPVIRKKESPGLGNFKDPNIGKELEKMKFSKVVYDSSKVHRIKREVASVVITKPKLHNRLQFSTVEYVEISGKLKTTNLQKVNRFIKRSSKSIDTLEQPEGSLITDESTDSSKVTNVSDITSGVLNNEVPEESSNLIDKIYEKLADNVDMDGEYLVSSNANATKDLLLANSNSTQSSNETLESEHTNSSTESVQIGLKTFISETDIGLDNSSLLINDDSKEVNRSFNLTQSMVKTSGKNKSTADTRKKETTVQNNTLNGIENDLNSSKLLETELENNQILTGEGFLSTGLISSIGFNFSELAKNAASAIDVFNFSDSITDHIVDDKNDLHDFLDLTHASPKLESETKEQNAFKKQTSETDNEMTSSDIIEEIQVEEESNVLVQIEMAQSQNETQINGQQNETSMSSELAANVEEKTKECPPSGICILWFLSEDTCIKDSECLNTHICCKIGCSNTCIEGQADA